MTYDRLGATGLDYRPCRYGESRTLFRGPKADLTQDYVLFLGGTATYGKFIPRPYPALVETRMRLTSVNLGAVNAGPDLYLNDPELLAMTAGAVATVIQLPGAANLTNRYYSVHPRRNDRFLRASPLLRTVFRDVDFARYSFTRHMMQALQDLSQDRFNIVMAELQEAWVGRMRQLIESISGPVILLWIGDTPIPDACIANTPVAACRNPLFIDRGMVAALEPHASTLIEVAMPMESDASVTDGMVFSQMEAAAAHSQFGITHHVAAAEALMPELAALISGQTALLN